ncbi:MAG: sodium/solute symporter [Desulfobacterales bacterium]
MSVPKLTVTTLDLAILIVYVLGSRIIFGWYIVRKRRQGDTEGYFLGGRNIHWTFIGLSFYVSNMSGSTFVGLPGSGYLNGIAVYNYEWLPVAILILFITFILPFYLESRVFTAPQFLEKRYNHHAKLFFSCFLLLANIFIDAAAALYAGAMVMQVLFPNFPLWQTVAVSALIAGVYIFFGGLDAVVLNDTVQALLILVGGTVISVMTFKRLSSWEAFKQAVAPAHLSLIQPASDPVLPWPGIFTGVLIVGLYFWCTNQFVIQRALGARSLEHGRRGSLLAGLLKLPNLFILVLPGVMAQTIYQNLDNPDMVFPLLAFDLLPIGLRGLMLAALAAAILSSLESIFNSAATLFTMDFVKHFYPRLSEPALVRTGKAATIGFMFLSALWAPQIARFPSLWQYLQSILAYITPPVVVIFMFGIFWHRGTATAATVTLAAGIPIGLLGWVFNEIAGVYQIQFLYACGLMTLVSGMIFMGTSLITTKPSDHQLAALTWNRSFWRRESRQLKNLVWYYNYRYQSAVLMAAALIIVLIWW